MQVTHLREAEILDLISVSDLIEPIATAFRDHTMGIARDTARQRTHMPEGTLHVLQAASTRLDRIGFKSYFPGRSARTFLVQMIELSTGRLIGLVEADELGILRTGAATAVATRTLARPGASVLACFGTGRHSVIQALSVAAVRPIAEIRVFGRNQKRIENFSAEIDRLLGISPISARTPEAALAGADIVNIVTRSPLPLFPGSLVAPGMHLNAVGSNALSRREIDLDAIRAAGVIVVDSVEVARRECGDLSPAADSGLIDWHTLRELGAVLSGKRTGRRSDDEVTLFESQGMGLLDLYAADTVLSRAQKAGVGRSLEL